MNEQDRKYLRSSQAMVGDIREQVGYQLTKAEQDGDKRAQYLEVAYRALADAHINIGRACR